MLDAFAWLYVACIILAYLLPLGLLVVRWHHAARVSWGRFVGWAIFGGWALVVAGAACSHFAQVLALQAHPAGANPESMAQVQQWQDVKWALWTGWIYGTMGALQGLMAYGLLKWARRHWFTYLRKRLAE